MLKCKDGTTTWSWLTKKVSLEMYWVQAQNPFLKKKNQNTVILCETELLIN